MKFSSRITRAIRDIDDVMMTHSCCARAFGVRCIIGDE
jgi:hypothetical protein